jgi:hypothetical protein
MIITIHFSGNFGVYIPEFKVFVILEKKEFKLYSSDEFE